MPALIFRADGDSHIGAGHLMRCLALAQAFQPETQVTFACAGIAEGLRARLGEERLEVVDIAAAAGSPEDAAALIDLAHQQGAEWVVVDGYHLGAEYQEPLRAAGLKVLYLDDHGLAGRYVANLVLDQNVGAPEEPYRYRAADTQLLLGTRYALLRRAYLEWPAQSDWQREIPAQARKLLVTLGGADPHNTTAKILQALAYVPVTDLYVRVVIGAANPHVEALRATAADCPHAVELITGAGELVELMAWADAIVVPGSVTCWEALYMGVPPLLPILVDNQGASAARLEELGVGVNLGWHHSLEPEAVAAAITAVLKDPVRRAEMSVRGRELVDGQGAQRVRAAMDTWPPR